MDKETELLNKILEQQKVQSHILDRLLANLGVPIQDPYKTLYGVSDTGNLKGQEAFSLSCAKCEEPVQVLLFNRVITGIAKCEIYQYERVKIVGGNDYQPEVAPLLHKHFHENPYIKNGTVTTGSTDIATAYNNSTEIIVENELGRVGTEGFILNLNTVSTLYVWFSYDGTKYYSSDPARGRDYEYIPILPKTQLSINPYEVWSVKIGANANSTDYTIVIS